jgi:hypothetical protein
VAAAVRQRIADTGGGVGARPAGRRRPIRRPLAVAAAVALVLALVVAAVPRTRHAVADRLGLRGVSVRVVPTTAPATPATTGPAPTATGSTSATTVPLPSGLELGRPTTLAGAAAATTVPLLVPAELPTGVHVDDRTGEVNMTFVGGVLLGQFPNAVPLFEKRVDPDAEVVAVTVDGGRGLWLPAPAHVFVELANGDGALTESRLAGPTLVWEHGDTTLRVEGLPTLEAALAFATSLRPYG